MNIEEIEIKAIYRQDMRMMQIFVMLHSIFITYPVIYVTTLIRVI